MFYTVSNMTNAKSLTRDDLKAVFKDLGVTTKDDLKSMESRQDKKMQESLLRLERQLKLRMGKHRNELFAMIGRLTTSTPSRREFEQLKDHTGRFIAHS